MPRRQPSPQPVPGCAACHVGRPTGAAAAAAAAAVAVVAMFIGSSRCPANMNCMATSVIN